MIGTSLKPYSTKPGVGEFGQRLKEERIRRGFKVDEFADLVGCASSQVTGAENRGVTPRFWTVVAMAKVLECSIDWLAGVEE